MSPGLGSVVHGSDVGVDGQYRDAVTRMTNVSFDVVILLVAMVWRCWGHKSMKMLIVFSEVVLLLLFVVSVGARVGSNGPGRWSICDGGGGKADDDDYHHHHHHHHHHRLLLHNRRHVPERGRMVMITPTSWAMTSSILMRRMRMMMPLFVS